MGRTFWDKIKQAIGTAKANDVAYIMYVHVATIMTECSVKQIESPDLIRCYISTGHLSLSVIAVFLGVSIIIATNIYFTILVFSL